MDEKSARKRVDSLRADARQRLTEKPKKARPEKAHREPRFTPQEMAKKLMTGLTNVSDRRKKKAAETDGHGARKTADYLARAAGKLAAIARSPRSAGTPPVDTDSLSAALAGWRRVGWAIIVVFMGGSVVWAANAQLDSAVIASGVVGVETSRKTVQHLEGGIVEEILVRDGERVEAGQVLIRFDDTQPRAMLKMLTGQHAAALALHARLVAERDGRDEIAFPDELLERSDEPEISVLMITQMDVFKSHTSTIDKQERIIKGRIQELRREITGLQSQATSGHNQLRLLDEEIGTMQMLVKKGIASKSRLLELQRKAAEVQGDLGNFQAQIARAKESIGELDLRLTMPSSDNHNQVTEQLQSVQARIADLGDKLHAAKDILRRTEVTAPQSGKVLDLRIHTRGGVVQPGHKLLDLVPDQDRLIIDVRVNPNDIDAVYADMPARVRLTAFNARTTPTIEGRVTSISADRVTDQATGSSYFTARVVPAGAAPIGFDLDKVTPGMQAEVFLVTTERTALDYLIEPLTRSFARAGREQ